jgi:hypothetical protein
LPESTLHDRSGNVDKWTIAELTLILLRQFKRLLDERNADFSDSELRDIADKVETHQPAGEKMLKIRAVMADVVMESVEFLAGWDLTFAQSLLTDMNALSAHWETTADFLDVANHKANAELRISAGSALIALLGGSSHAGYLMQTIEHDLSVYGSLDIDALIARRALLYAANIPHDAPDWLTQLRGWLAENP